MPFDHPLDETVEIDLVAMSEPLGGFQSGRGIEIVQQRAEILRLLDARDDGVRVEGFAGLDALLE